MYAKIVRCTQSSNMSPLEFVDALWFEDITCPGLCEEYMLKGNFIEGLLESISHSMRYYWSRHKSGLL